MNRSTLNDTWRGLSGSSRAALGLLAGALVVVLWLSPSVFSALFAGSLQSVAQSGAPDEGEALAYNQAVRDNVDFISRRSPFFVPVGPRQETPPVRITGDNTPPPPPRTYGGPKLVGLAGHEVAVFASEVYNGSPFIRIGDQGGVVELLSIEQPWKVKVRWSGADFELNLFDRLEAVPVINYGGAMPGAPPTVNIFGNGTSSTAAGGLDFGATAGEDSADNN